MLMMKANAPEATTLQGMLTLHKKILGLVHQHGEECHQF